MKVTVQIPATLRAYCRESAAEWTVPASTVRGALAELERTHPALYRGVCDETGAVRRHVHLFVNDSLVRGPDGLDRRFAPGDVLSIMPAVSGG